MISVKVYSRWVPGILRTFLPLPPTKNSLNTRFCLSFNQVNNSQHLSKFLNKFLISSLSMDNKSKNNFLLQIASYDCLPSVTILQRTCQEPAENSFSEFVSFSDWQRSSYLVPLFKMYFLLGILAFSSFLKQYLIGQIISK